MALFMTFAPFVDAATPATMTRRKHPARERVLNAPLPEVQDAVAKFGAPRAIAPEAQLAQSSGRPRLENLRSRLTATGFPVL
ncbi:MAG TPA: hypothetical protein VFE13_06110, partial [Caulobacteraceae bacterium]|nr:hypothetical protein [Caulobacteraceae bacterium]